VVDGLPVAEQTPRGRDPWKGLRYLALSLYLAALLYESFFDEGVPIGRDRVILWTVGALVCASIGTSWRRLRQIAIDWVPFAAVLIAYDYSRGAADSLGMSVNYTPQIDADRWLFWGHVPTEWLEQHLFHLRFRAIDLSVRAVGPVRWYEIVFDLTYLSHYLVAFIVAGVLWVKDRSRFVGFARRFVTLSFAGFVTYALFPAAPPWKASQDGYLAPGIGRLGGRGDGVIGLKFVRDVVDKGAAVSNLVAAVPSLHAGYATLVVITVWRSVPRFGRPLLVLYPVVMGITLVATGEHYVIVILGVVYAVAVNAAWDAIERRLAARRAAKGYTSRSITASQ
jgi:hypothetical protein